MTLDVTRWDGTDLSAASAGDANAEQTVNKQNKAVFNLGLSRIKKRIDITPEIVCSALYAVSCIHVAINGILRRAV